MKQTSSPWFGHLCMAATLLTLFIVVLGAYVRLSHAGLGCPDWPGCYGHLGVPQTPEDIARANAAFPERPVEVAKGWKEMVHRYFASSLGLVLIGLGIWSWVLRKSNPSQQTLIPTLLIPLVCLQGAFGMWTVTLKVHPVFVTLHLLFGLLTLSLIWLMWLKQVYGAMKPNRIPANLRRLAPIAIVVVILQIALGGWVSTNYAALHCTDFPTCQGEYWPEMDFADAFNVFLPIGPDYEGGHLDNTSRVTIHMTHRIGAIVTFLFVLLLCVRCYFTGKHALIRKSGAIAFALLLTQIGLGISNVIFSLPMAVAVAHNGVAALLLLTLIAINFFIRTKLP